MTGTKKAVVSDDVNGHRVGGEDNTETGLKYCPVCETTSDSFLTSGIVPRKNAKCGTCSARERHRLIWAYFEKMTDLFDGASNKKMLHVAPEKAFEPRLRQRLGEGYLTADLYMSQAMVKMDITDIQYPDNTFDVIYCCHVLEHVEDDLLAMREFRRVLKPDGWAVLMVPVSADKTFEDPSVTDPQLRLKLFGQEDHVRLYGPDYIDRLKSSGFNVKLTRPDEFLSDAEIERMWVKRRERIYFCTK